MSKKHKQRYQLVENQPSGWTIIKSFKYPPKGIAGGYMDHRGRRYIGNYEVVDTFKFKSEGKTSWKQSVFTTQNVWTVLVLLILSVTITAASMFAAYQ